MTAVEHRIIDDVADLYPGPVGADAGAVQAAQAGRRVLLLATIFRLPYRVLRCARASGAEVFVLGNAGARGLRLSRYCRGFVLSDQIIHGGRDEALALQINAFVREHGISMVLAGDAPATRALIATRDLIEAPCFPLPRLEHFDLLNNKWEFARICKELSIRQPATRLLPDTAALARELAAGRLGSALVVKPLSRTGNEGIVYLDGVDTGRRLRSINYRPVLVQEFIAGRDIGASVYARGGRVEAFIAHQLWHQVYSVLDPQPIYGDIDKIVRHLKLDGVYNFDMRLAWDRTVYFLECNPRFFYKMHMSMIAGVNFVQPGLGGIRPTGRAPLLAQGSVRLPKGLLHALVTSGRCSRRDWAMAGYLAADPVPYWIERLDLAV